MKLTVFLRQILKKRDTLIEAGCHLIFIGNWIDDCIDLAYEARQKGCSVYLDICENIFDTLYEDYEFGISKIHLQHFSKSFDKIIVPTQRLSNLVNKIIGSTLPEGNKKPVVIIPNIADHKNELEMTIEYMKMHSSAEEYARLQSIDKKLEQIDISKNNRENLLWFGDAYSPMSNMEIASLIPHLGRIKKMQEINSFKLVVCTNKNVDLSMLDEYSIRYSKTEWSLVNIYSEIFTAAACLITTGGDASSQSKSNSKVLLALANKCPVIGINLSDSEELKEVMITSVEVGIDRYIISEHSEINRNHDLSKAEILMERFSPKRIGSIYNLLFDNQECRILTNSKIEESKESEIKEDSISKSLKKHPMPLNIPGTRKPLAIDSNGIELLLVCGIGDRNWILDGIAKEIGSRSKLKWSIYYSPKNPESLPKSKHVMFMHQTILRKFIQKDLIQDGTKAYCWYTHPRDETEEIVKQQKECFEKCKKVFFACSPHRDMWTERGLSEDISKVVIGGFDENIFKFRRRNKSQSIGICSSFYERKNPSLIHDIIKNMRDRHFILIGKGWQKYALFEELMGLGNISYYTLSYKQYYYYYSKMAVFLSASTIEGGPIPLIEAMAANCIPVVSDTGFAKDLIKNRENGFIFPLSASADSICELLREAINMNTINISKTVEQYSWNSFSHKICNSMLNIV